MIDEKVLELARNFAVNEYRNKQMKCWDGDPKGFAIIYNKRSKKCTSLPLLSKKLHTLSNNAVHVYSVCDNGSLEAIID